MRTTVDVEEDVLSAARDIASRRGVSIGRVISELAREGLLSGPRRAERNGIPLFELGEAPASVSLEIVNRLRDEGS